MGLEHAPEGQFDYVQPEILENPPKEMKTEPAGATPPPPPEGPDDLPYMPFDKHNPNEKTDEQKQLDERLKEVLPSDVNEADLYVKSNEQREQEEAAKNYTPESPDNTK